MGTGGKVLQTFFGQASNPRLVLITLTEPSPNLVTVERQPFIRAAGAQLPGVGHGIAARRSRRVRRSVPTPRKMDIAYE